MAGLLALGAIDSALHDAWSRTAARSPYEMYTREYMNQDLGWVIPELAGAHPGDQLGPRRSALPVQHALGVWAIPCRGSDDGDPGSAAGRHTRLTSLAVHVMLHTESDCRRGWHYDEYLTRSDA